ncbi:MAG: acyl-CoA dehydrogenase family protein, partial [Acidobacteriota bacterium]
MDADTLLTEEERMVRDTVRAFVDDKVKPIIEECHREGRTPLELVPEMGALNLFGASLSEYGLPGLGGCAYGLIMQELERGDSGLRSFVSVQSSLVMYPIYTFGSNPGGMRTTAKKVGNEWVLNGSKQWITNGTLADVAVVWAKTEDGIRGFVVEKGTPGFTSSDQHGKFSLRASTTSELGFHD